MRVSLMESKRVARGVHELVSALRVSAFRLASYGAVLAVFTPRREFTGGGTFLF